ncbi:hypothetical protein GTA08_BOTSDO02461 [Botryosphaeria dothidea]|uniref:Uncharacterized protein n=1 Tax=Botryosphaeria dothidea TaxID=55169 RepID=A0A8H4N6J1_9PEZI|nr:hypothetical protein GTA08_BOTSDO02461 [Botryosphaeria dothidea]
MSGPIQTTYISAPNSPASFGPASPSRRRSSIFSGIANSFGSNGSSSAVSHSRRGSKWSIASCFSESSNPDKNEASSSAASQKDFTSPPVSPLSANFDQSTIASRRRSYVPKRAAESFSISTTPIYAREAGTVSVSSLASKRMSYATQYGFKTPTSEKFPMETVADTKE